MSFKEKIKSNPRVRKTALLLLHPKRDPKPRWWVRFFVTPFTAKKGKGSIIRNKARLDIFPYNQFELGEYSVIEDFTVINNAVGNVKIGNGTMIGIANVIIGPVKIGSNVMLAQNVVLSGLNHGYEDVSIPPSAQDVICKQITIKDNCWIGANAVVTAGITIGKHSIIGAGSVVTADVPDYCVAIGSPARVVKKYNENTGLWERTKPLNNN